MHPRSLLQSSPLVLFVALFGFGLRAQGARPERAPATAPAAAVSGSLADAPLSAARIGLLEIAYAAASALPVDPHVKTRSLAQEGVVSACLRLGLPLRAERYAADIRNWRRGACLADVGLYLAQHGAPGEARLRLARAAHIADEGMGDANAQAWRRDRVRAKIASAYVVLGEPARAGEFTEAAVPREADRVEAARASVLAPEDFAGQVTALENILAGGDFDQVQNALETCVQLFDRFYDDVERRTSMATKVTTAFAKLPVALRIGLVSKLANIAVAHEDSAYARDLIDTVQGLIDKAPWRPQDHVRLLADVAALRWRAGDGARAQKDVKVALSMFDIARDDIQDMERAGVLRPVAEAFQAMGDTAQALAAYRRAIDDGAANPNARPRAVDLASTCLSMAEHGVEPDSALEKKIAEVLAGLRDPW